MANNNSSLEGRKMIRFACISCDKDMLVRDELLGKKVRCPKCGNVQRVTEDEIEERPKKRRQVPTAIATTRLSSLFFFGFNPWTSFKWDCPDCGARNVINQKQLGAVQRCLVCDEPAH